MATVPWLKAALRKRRLCYQESRHAAAFTAQDLAEKEHLSGWHVAKVVVAMADGRPVQLVLPANRSVDLERARRMLDAKELRLAREEEMSRIFADCEIGAEPPLPHWKGVELWMDDSLRTGGDILFQAGTHEDAVRMRFRDWFRLAQPRVGWFTDA